MLELRIKMKQLLPKIFLESRQMRKTVSKQANKQTFVVVSLAVPGKYLYPLRGKYTVIIICITPVIICNLIFLCHCFM